MKERWFNYRPLCLIFGFLLLGSVFAFYAPKYTIISLIVMFMVIAALIVLAVVKKKPQYALVPIIAFVIGLSSFYIATSSFNNMIDEKPTTIQARIYNVQGEDNGMIRVEADSCVFDGKNVRDNIIIYIYDNDGIFENIGVGSIIKFKPYKFYKSDLIYKNTPSSSLYANDLKYTASVTIENIEYIKSDRTFAEMIKDRIKDNISLGLNNENTEIAYSALFGDKDLLSDKQYSSYKLSGVAHLLAVSGLHVGIISKILRKSLKFDKKKRWWKFFVIAIFLLFYMYICDYSVSIIRASIMTMILLISIILGKEYDPFNSISVAGIILFIINPLVVFDVAFLLSFSCIIAITMLHAPIHKFLQKIKVPEKLSNAMAMSLSTSLGIIIIMAYYFKTLNIISLIANIILIPIFACAFSIVFVVAFVSLLLPYLTYILYPLNYIFSSINIIATVLGNLSISNFNTLEFNFIAIIIYFVLLLFAGRFCTAKYQYKLISTLPIVALLFYCLL